MRFNLSDIGVVLLGAGLECFPALITVTRQGGGKGTGGLEKLIGNLT